MINEIYAKFLMSLTVIWIGMNCLDPQVLLEVCNRVIGEISHFAAKIRENFQQDVDRLSADELMYRKIAPEVEVAKIPGPDLA